MKLIGYEEANTKTGGYSSYILVSQIPNVLMDGPDEMTKTDPIKAFLGTLLTFIFMGESPIDEGLFIFQLMLQKIFYLSIMFLILKKAGLIIKK